MWCSTFAFCSFCEGSTRPFAQVLVFLCFSVLVYFWPNAFSKLNNCFALTAIFSAIQTLSTIAFTTKDFIMRIEAYTLQSSISVWRCLSSPHKPLTSIQAIYFYVSSSRPLTKQVSLFTLSGSDSLRFCTDTYKHRHTTPFGIEFCISFLMFLFFIIKDNSN